MLKVKIFTDDRKMQPSSLSSSAASIDTHSLVNRQQKLGRLCAFLLATNYGSFFMQIAPLLNGSLPHYEQKLFNPNRN